jgi:hypothetical protein
MATKTNRESKASRKQRKREREQMSVNIAERAFSREESVSDNVVKNIKLISEGKCELRDFSGFNNRKKYNFYKQIIEDKKAKHPSGVYEFFVKISNKKFEKMLEDDRVLERLISLSQLNNLFIRDVESWKKKTYNPERQFSSLVRHLLCEYSVPDFMDSAWNLKVTKFYNKRYPLSINRWNLEIPSAIQWFLDIGNGKNIRNSENLPISFTKKMAHEFLKAPSKCTINEAIRRAQVISKGGDERLAETVNATFLSREFKNEEFWSTVIDFLVRNTMIDPVRVGPMLDYIAFQKYEIRREWVNGRNIEVAAENPNFSMKGRNAQSLLDNTEEWHERINAVRARKRKTPTSWEGSPIPNFKHEEGTDHNMVTYEIVQILDYKGLSEEGRSMKHCVASYAGSCSSGRCAIFSLRKFSRKGFERMVTIEVLRDGKIVQIRGKSNRKPTSREMNLINRWVTKEKLTYASYY